MGTEQTNKQTNKQRHKQKEPSEHASALQMEAIDDGDDADGNDGGADGGDGGDADAPGQLLHEAPPPQDPTHLHRGRT